MQARLKNSSSPPRRKAKVPFPPLIGKPITPKIRSKGQPIPVLPLQILSKPPSLTSTPIRPGHHRVSSLPFFATISNPPTLSQRTSTQRPSPHINRTTTLARVIGKATGRMMPEVTVVTSQGAIRGKLKKENQDSNAVLHGFMGVSNSVMVMVCDGHGENGHLISRYIVSHLPCRLNSLHPHSVRDLEDSLKEQILSEILNLHWEVINAHEFSSEFSGSTLVTVIIKDNSVLCANVGDSRAVLIYTDRGEWFDKQLTIDHKPDLVRERERIEASFGRVQSYVDEKGRPQGPMRVWLLTEDTPGLAMSRSIGDTLAHSVGVSETPDISVHCILPEDKAIVIASDGLWDVLSNSDVTSIVSRHFMCSSFELCAKALVKSAEQIWRKSGDSVDDITVAVVWLRRSE